MTTDNSHVKSRVTAALGPTLVVGTAVAPYFFNHSADSVESLNAHLVFHDDEQLGSLLHASTVNTIPFRLATPASQDDAKSVIKDDGEVVSNGRFSSGQSKIEITKPKLWESYKPSNKRFSGGPPDIEIEKPKLSHEDSNGKLRGVRQIPKPYKDSNRKFSSGESKLEIPKPKGFSSGPPKNGSKFNQEAVAKNGPNSSKLHKNGNSLASSSWEESSGAAMSKHSTCSHRANGKSKTRSQSAGAVTGEKRLGTTHFESKVANTTGRNGPPKSRKCAATVHYHFRDGKSIKADGTLEVENKGNVNIAKLDAKSKDKKSHVTAKEVDLDDNGDKVNVSTASGSWRKGGSYGSFESSSTRVVHKADSELSSEELIDKAAQQGEIQPLNKKHSEDFAKEFQQFSKDFAKRFKHPVWKF